MKSIGLWIGVSLVALVGSLNAVWSGPDSDSCDVVNVAEYGARGDGTHDDTQAFHAAVEAAAQQRKNIYVPIGTYSVSETIVLDKMSMNGPTVSAWVGDENVHMPSIIPRHQDGPAFRMLASSALEGIDIHYEGVGPDAGEGPAAIRISGTGAYIRNLRIRQAWDGITTDGENNGRLNIENVFMAGIRNVGVHVSRTFDVPRLNNVEVWNNHFIVLDNRIDGGRALKKGIGFHFTQNNDLLRMTDCFVFNMNRAFVFEQIETLSGDGEVVRSGGTWGVMNGCAADACNSGVEIAGDHRMSIDGGFFWCHGTGLYVHGKEAAVRFSDCEVKSNGAPAIRVAECGHTLVTGCSIISPMQEHKVPIADLSGGNIILNNNYAFSTADGLVIGEGVRSLHVMGNTLEIQGRPFVLSEKAPGKRIFIKDNVEVRQD